MKKAMIGLALAAFACTASAQHYRAYKAPKLSGYSQPAHYNGYVKKDGTYVQPHYQTAPDNTKVNNWSSKPNVNPYTGQEGTKDPYATGH